MPKIIDFATKGNVVRFYLGRDDEEEYWGDDWDDLPYDCNAGKVYDEYIIGYVDWGFPFDDKVIEPANGVLNCEYSKEDMKNRKVPCIIVVPADIAKDEWCEDFDYWIGNADIIKYYFGDTYNGEYIKKDCEKDG